MFISKIIIKQTEKSDLPNILGMWNNGETMKYVGFPNGLGWTMNDMNKWFEELQAQKEYVHCSIYADDVGFCGETSYETHELEHITRNMGLEIKLLPVAQGKGIASYALKYAIDMAYNSGSFDVVHAEPHPENEAAIKLYKKLGLKFAERPQYLHPADTYMELDLTEWHNYRY